MIVDAYVANYIAHLQFLVLGIKRLVRLTSFIEEELQTQLYLREEVLDIRTLDKAFLCANASSLTVCLPFLMSLLADKVFFLMETSLFLCCLAGD